MNRTYAKPFLKWAGGKTGLLPELRKYYPARLGLEGGPDTYVEPFVGAGAVLFDLLGEGRVTKAVICDINRELMTSYRVVRDRCRELTGLLARYEADYNSAGDERKKELYLEMRREFNLMRSFSNLGGEMDVSLTAHLLFLNKTCFNGLYRVNRRGEFNVPFNRAAKIHFDTENLMLAGQALADTEILDGDYRQLTERIDGRCFIYVDPPYRPLTKTASFTDYDRLPFGDDAQRQLAAWAREQKDKGAFVMLSNSDPHNADPEDDFFDELYADFEIHRVSAVRNINSDKSGRGHVSELLITGY